MMKAKVKDTNDKKESRFGEVRSDSEGMGISTKKYLKSNYKSPKSGYSIAVSVKSDIQSARYTMYTITPGFMISERTLKMIEGSIKDLEKGNVSEPIDFKELDELLD